MKKLVEDAGYQTWIYTVGHPVMEGEGGKKFLCPISVVTFQSGDQRRKIYAHFKKFVSYWEYDSQMDEKYTPHKVKIAPGITQTERRLESPLHSLMSAYTAAFTVYRKVSYIPKWKTLTLLDDKEAWTGRVRCTRTETSTGFANSQHGKACPSSDWKCEVLIPTETYKQVMEQWCKTWSAQVRQQIMYTDA